MGLGACGRFLLHAALRANRGVPGRVPGCTIATARHPYPYMGKRASEPLGEAFVALSHWLGCRKCRVAVRWNRCGATVPGCSGWHLAVNCQPAPGWILATENPHGQK